MKILLVAARFPFPVRRGDQMRAQQLIELLGREHELTLLAPGPPASGAPALPSTVRLEVYRRRPQARALAGALLGELPLQAVLFGGSDLRRRLRRLAPRADVVVMQKVRLAAHLADLAGTPVVLDFIDSLSLSFTRRAALDAPWLRPLWRAEAARLARTERRALAAAERGVVVCGRDRDGLGGGLTAGEAARVEVVPLAVAAEEAPPEAPAGARPCVAFTGNLGYFANADAARWLCREIWPEMRRRRPEVRLLIAGDRPDAALRRAARGAGADLEAAPADLRRLLGRATVALAPMRAGAGQPLKVMEAWAAGVPVVGSPWALAGTSGRAGEDFLVAEAPGDWVAAILRLLDDAAARRALAAAGRRRLQEDYSPALAGRRWRELLAAAAGAGAAR